MKFPSCGTAIFFISVRTHLWERRCQCQSNLNSVSVMIHIPKPVPLWSTVDVGLRGNTTAGPTKSPRCGRRTHFLLRCGLSSPPACDSKCRSLLVEDLSTLTRCLLLPEKGRAQTNELLIRFIQPPSLLSPTQRFNSRTSLTFPSGSCVRQTWAAASSSRQLLLQQCAKPRLCHPH